MRAFPFRLRGRLLRVAVVAVDEGWQLWVCEEDRRLTYGGHVSVDDAIAGWRLGADRVLELAEEVKSNVLTGKLVVCSEPGNDSTVHGGDMLPPPNDGSSRALDKD